MIQSQILSLLGKRIPVSFPNTTPKLLEEAKPDRSFSYLNPPKSRRKEKIFKPQNSFLLAA
jgi:hypothetical protein